MSHSFESLEIFILNLIFEFLAYLLIYLFIYYIFIGVFFTYLCGRVAVHWQKF